MEEELPTLHRQLFLFWAAVQKLFTQIILRANSKAPIFKDGHMKYFALIATIALIGCASSKKNTNPTPAETKPAAAAPAAAPQKAVAKEDKGGTLSSCTHGDDTRLLQIAPKGKGCVLNYTKNGTETAIASSANGNDHCMKTKAKILKNLEASGYTCK